MNKDKSADINWSEYTRIAYYYHKVGLTQEDIAQKMSMSRQRVNRILSECIDLGIVKISVMGYEESYLELETALEKKYGITAVRIAGPITEEDMGKKLGTTAGEYLAGIINNGDIIGFSRGRATLSLVANMPPVDKKGLTVTQLMGSWNSQQTRQELDDIIHRFSAKLGATPVMMHAPIIVKDQKLRDSITHEPYFVEAYKTIKACTIAVVGIGDAKDKTNTITVADEHALAYIEKNAVGEVSTYFFDQKGNIVPTPFQDRVIAIELEDFLKIPTRIGIAGLASKRLAIEGALRGHFINVLITDLETAEALL